MKRRCVIEHAVGESRAAVYISGQLSELYVRRWSEADKPRIGDVFAGRITAIDKDMGAAFVALGHGPDGVLKFTNAPHAPRFREGVRVDVSITREAESGKGPVLKFEKISDQDKVMRLSGLNLQAFITDRFGKACRFEDATVSSIDTATEAEIALPGGGSIAIERTRALIAIDVDKGRAKSGFDAALSASAMIAGQLRLRGLGGLIVIDFPNIRQPKQRDTLTKALETAFADDPHQVKIAPLSRFGLVEMTRSKSGLSLDETLNDRFGNPTVETLALRALRQLEREGRSNAGAQLTLGVPEPVYQWLDRDNIAWRAAMTERLGARFTLERDNQISIKADR